MKTKNQKRHYWYVDTGLYHKPIKVLATGMSEAAEMAYLLFIQMDYKKFKEYVSLNVSGSNFYKK